MLKKFAFTLLILGILYNLILANLACLVEALEPFRVAKVKVGLLPVYSDNQVTSGILKFLKKGERVEVLAETVISDSKWCSVRESGRKTMTGFVNCYALEFFQEEKKDSVAPGKKPPPVARQPEEPKSTARPIPRKLPKETKESPPFGEFLQVLWKEDIGRVQEMLEKGIDPNKQTSFGTRPLLIVAKKRNPELLKVLIENGAGVDGKDGSGLTALMAASSMGLAANDMKRDALSCGLARLHGFIGGKPIQVTVSHGLGIEPCRCSGNTVLDA